MSDELAEGVFAAWAVRAEAGEDLSFDELLRGHPGIGDELRRLHDDWKLFAPLLGRVVPGLIASSEHISMPPLSSADDEGVEPPSAELLDRLGIHAPNTGRYRFRSVIGRGGGGVVLKVWDTKLNRPLAMKVVLGRGEGGRPTGDTPKVDGRTLSRFVDEARIASQLNHPGIVPVHELGADETGRAFFTMKLVRGETLATIFEHVKTGKDGWNQTRALTVLLRVCEAMAFAHDRGVIHRDLKPANIMVGRYGEVYVMDWGLARVLGDSERIGIRVPTPSTSNKSVVDSLRASDRDAGSASPLMTAGGQALGTPAYMSPEQARGDVDAIDARSDVFSIGAMLYELLAGHMPYSERHGTLDAHTMLHLVKEGPPQSLSRLASRSPAELVAIADKAMARDPRQRYVAMLHLSSDVRAFLEGHVVSAYETGRWAETRKWISRHRLAASSGLAFSICTLAALFLLLHQNRALASVIASKELIEHESRSRGERLTKSDAHIARATYASELRLAESYINDGRLRQAWDHLLLCPEPLREFEWRYLAATAAPAVDYLPTVGYPHYQARSLKYDPRGRYIATGIGGAVALWDATSHVCVTELTASGLDDVEQVAFSADGCQVVASGRGLIAIWNTDTLELNRIISTPNLGEHRYLSFSAQDSRLVCASSHPFSVIVWDTRTWIELLNLSYRWSDDGVSSPVALHPSQDVIYLSDARMLLALNFSHDPVQLRYIDVPGSPTGLDVSANARCIAVSGYSYVGRLDLDHDAFVTLRTDELGAYNVPTFDKLGERVLTVSHQGQLRVWDTATGALFNTINVGHDCDEGFSFAPDGRQLACAAHFHILESRSSGSSLHLPTAGPLTAREWSDVVAFSSDGTHLATANFSAVALWNSLTGDLLGSVALPEDDEVVGLSFGQDHDAIYALLTSPRRVQAWDTRSWSVLWSTEVDDTGYSDITFSDGTLKHGTAWINALSGELVALPEHSWRIGLCINSPHNRLLVLDGGDLFTCRRHDMLDRVTLSDDVASVTASADGSLVVASASGSIWNVYNTEDWSVVSTIREDQSAKFSFSRDCRRLASMTPGGHTKIWDASNGDLLVSVRVDNGGNDGVPVFSPDFTRLAVPGWHGTWICETALDSSTARKRAFVLQRRDRVLSQLQQMYATHQDWDHVYAELGKTTIRTEDRALAERLMRLWM